MGKDKDNYSLKEDIKLFIHNSKNHLDLDDFLPEITFFDPKIISEKVPSSKIDIKEKVKQIIEVSPL